MSTLSELSDECRSYLSKAATMLDCAVQLCGDPVIGPELDAIEARLDTLAAPKRPIRPSGERDPNEQGFQIG